MDMKIKITTIIRSCHHVIIGHLLADPPPSPSSDDVLYEQPLTGAQSQNDCRFIQRRGVGCQFLDLRRFPSHSAQKLKK